jgi:hypothetical protein
MVPARPATYVGGIDSLESSPGLHSSLKIRLWVNELGKWVSDSPPFNKKYAKMGFIEGAAVSPV